MARFNYIAALACEDTRREDNGKLMLIGIFGADIRFQSFPAGCILAFAIIGELPEVREMHSRFRVLLDGAELAQGQVSYVPDQPGRQILRTPSLEFGVLKPGAVTLQVGETDAEGKLLDDWTTLLTVPVVQHAATG